MESLEGVLESAPSGSSLGLLDDLNAPVDGGNETWRGVIGKNCHPDMNPSGVLLQSPVRKSFNSHLQESFNHVPVAVGDIEIEWTMLPVAVGFISPWPPALAGSVHSGVRVSRDENQHL